MPQERDSYNLLKDLIMKFKTGDLLYGKICKFSVHLGQLNSLIFEIKKLVKLDIQTLYRVIRPEA